MPAPDPTRLHVAYRRRLDRLRAVATARALAADGPDEAVPVVLDAQRAAVAAADAYLSLEAGLAARGSTEPWGIDPERLIGHVARGGALLEDVYGRNWRAAEASFTERITREVNTDVTLAERSATWIHTEGDPRIVGYRRVLGGGPSCALCVAASTRTYRSSDLRPIHAHCGCTTQAIYRDAPAPNVDKAFLNDLYRRAGSVRGSDLGRLRLDPDELPPGISPDELPQVAVTSTAELGPTLIAA